MRACLILIVMVVVVRGEWSDDPGNPLNLGSGIQPQIVSTSEGGAYVAWLSEGNYHIYLQRLDVYGNPQLITGGMLVSDAPNSSWIAVYHMNLVVDQQDNAIISSVDTRSGNWEVYIYKIDSQGNQLWGDSGLALSSSGGDNISPRLLVEPSDNSVVVSWSDNFTSLRFQRIGPDGQLLWGNNGIAVSSLNASLVSPQPVRCSDGNILFQAIRQTGSFPALTSQITQQKYTLAGNPVWASWILVGDPVGFPLGNWLQNVVPDNQGGAYSAWTELNGQNQTGMLQRIGVDGTESWSSPSELSTQSDHFRISPEITTPDDALGVYAVWGESDANQNNRGIFAQRIDSSGSRQWGDTGQAIELLSTSVYMDINVDNMGNDLLTAYIENTNPGSADIFASRLAPDGSSAWRNDLVTVTNSGLGKADLFMSKGPNCSFMVWSEAGEVKAHCLLEEGTLGIPGMTPDTLNYFPMAVGQVWSYAGILDSTYITVVDSHLMTGEPYYDFDAWYPYENINSFRNSGNQVLINSGAADQLLYDFGADLEAFWTFQFPGTDNSQITLTSIGDTLETPYGIFTNCIGFHRFIGADYEYYDWFAPDVGLVQRDVVTFAGPQRYQLYNIEQVVVGLDQEKHSIPESFILKQNFPNPFNPGTHIEYELSEPGEISVVIYDVKGALVSELQRGYQEAGHHKLEWQGLDQGGTPVPAGLYLCRASGADLGKTIKMVLLK